MNTRTRILFKVNDEVVITEDNINLTFDEIDVLKWTIVSECDCLFDEITVDVVEENVDVAEDIDISANGDLIFWRSTHHEPIQGVYCELVEGSDEYLDAMNDGTLIDKINFFV